MRYHLAAIFTVIVWGTTMVSTKVLLNEGLSPVEIMLIRFITAYFVMWMLYPKWQREFSISEELVFLGLGITSGSLYFIFENTALIYTTATNVSLICALIPLMAAFLIYLIYRDKPLSKWFYIGSAVSVAGAALVVLNGNFTLHISPLGDALAFLSICSWALYCVLVRLLKGSYNTLFVTRKIFFYSILTLMPYIIYVEPYEVSMETLCKPVVFLNLAFLGIIASSICYFLWTLSLRQLGVNKTNNYVYFTPLITILTAHIVLQEQVTIYVICGTALILCGLAIARKEIKNTDYDTKI